MEVRKARVQTDSSSIDLETFHLQWLSSSKLYNVANELSFAGIFASRVAIPVAVVTVLNGNVESTVGIVSSAIAAVGLALEGLGNLIEYAIDKRSMNVFRALGMLERTE